MARLKDAKQNPTAKLILATAFLFFVLYLILKPEKALSPEEINALLQNKDGSIGSLRKVELNAHTLKAPYLNGGHKIRDWNLLGDTTIDNNNYVRLTSARQDQAGNMFCKLPIEAQSFEMEFTFHIHGEGRFQGDGLAIWFRDLMSDLGKVFGALNYFKGLGIFVDTYRNGKRGTFPYVNLMLGDGKKVYNKDNDGIDTRLAGCVARGAVNPSSGVSKMRIVYVKDGYFSLDLKLNNNPGDWENCVTLSEIKLPPKSYLGFSAETGDLVENVDILENKIYALLSDDGTFIDSIDKLKTLMQTQSETEELKKKTSRNKKTTRKSLRRLIKSEKRIKQREQQSKQNSLKDDDKGRKYILILFLKIIFYSIFTVMLLFGLLLLAAKVLKHRRRNRHGLLD